MLSSKLHISSLIKIQKCFKSSTPKTIYALSSGYGKCGVAVIRVSGLRASTALKSLTGMTSLPTPRKALLKTIINPSNNEVLDEGLILWFPGPKSFTGEDCCEFQVHGGLAVVSGVLNALSSLENLKLAEPGEFTRRAFYSGKLDLIEVEGLADLIHAETELQRKQALLQKQGSLSKTYKDWKETLIKCLAHLEAHIDFEETETLESNLLNELFNDIEELKRAIETHLHDGHRGERLRNGVNAVILGQPNVGKSSLFNILCKRPAAIVTPIEGTTRDILEVHLNINGYPLILTDTAGLRSETEDIIEKEGIARALKSCETADLVLLVIDGNTCFNYLKANINKTFIDYLKEYLTKLQLTDLFCENESKLEFKKECLVILNKCDLIDIVLPFIENVTLISCYTGHNITELMNKLSINLKHLCGDPSREHPSMTQVRHREHLTKCLKYLKLLNAKEHFDTVLLAEDLRKTIRHLGFLTGNVTSEELLDVIFKDFCIGK